MREASAREVLDQICFEMNLQEGYQGSVAEDVIASLGAAGFQITPVPPPKEEWWRLDRRGRRINPEEPYEDTHEIIMEVDSYEVIGVLGPAGKKWGFVFNIGNEQGDVEGREVNWYPTREEAARMLAEYLKPEAQP